MNTSENPLLKKSPHPHGAICFNEVNDEHYMPALEEALRLGRERISQIENSEDEPQFKNTIEALETASEEVDLVTTVFFNLLSAHSNPNMQKLAGEISPLLSNFSSDIILNEKLFEKIKLVHKNSGKESLTAEQLKLLDDTYSNFTRNGALLDSDKKTELRQLDERLAKLTPKFNENVLKATNHFELLLTDKKDLAGLPESATEAAAEAAAEKGHEGSWLFTLHHPSWFPFMTYSSRRELREKMYRALASRAYKDDFDNQEVVKEIAQLRFDRARVLNYKTHASFVLEKRMAESPEKVHDFIKKLLRASKPAATKEIEELQNFAQSQGGPEKIMPWDYYFYYEKLKEEKFKINEEELRPYFSLQNVIAGVFEHAERLYGLNFKESKGYPTYHKDVQVFEVFEKSTGDFIALFYADFFPRESKQSGAWMTNFREQGLFQNEVVRPHVGIVCNFTKPTADKPSLLTFNEVRTLFHEFGHALHGMLSKCTYQSLSGTNVYWDFVELPSQVLENWTLEKESLDLFAKHYETGETIPQDLTEKIKESSKFMAGYASMRQLNFGRLDMAWHDQDPSSISDVSDFEREATAETQTLPLVDGTNSSCAFGHIFGGGYSAGYYSYKWAEVLDADAFELFKEKGLFDEESAQSFKENILERGGSEHPMELYKKFRGREPDPDALLRRDGLI